jgi:hypothetical protein
MQPVKTPQKSCFEVGPIASCVHILQCMRSEEQAVPQDGGSQLQLEGFHWKLTWYSPVLASCPGAQGSFIQPQAAVMWYLGRHCGSVWVCSWTCRVSSWAEDNVVMVSDEPIGHCSYRSSMVLFRLLSAELSASPKPWPSGNSTSRAIVGLLCAQSRSKLSRPGVQTVAV